MSINVYPESSTAQGLIASSGVVISSGALGTPAEGFYGTEFTITKNLPRGFYQGIPTEDNASWQRVTANNQSTILSSNALAAPFTITTAVSSYKIAYSSGWKQWSYPTWVVTTAINGLAFGNGRFVIRSQAQGPNVFGVSTDGINWTQGSAPTLASFTGDAGRNTISFGNGYFFSLGAVAGQFTLSTDGINWTTRNVNLTSVGTIERIVYNGTYYYAAPSAGFAAVSTDTLNWTTAPVYPNGSVTLTLQTVNTWFVMGNTTNGSISISSNGTTWTTRSVGITGDAKCIAYGNGTYALVSDVGEIVISTDFTTWTAKTPANWTSALRYIHYANGYFMTVGQGGGNAGSTWKPGNFSSTDGNVWTSRSISPYRDTSTGFVVTYGNSLWMSVSTSSSTQIFISPDVAGYVEGSGSSTPLAATLLQGYDLDYSA